MALGLSFIFGSITMVVLTIACFLIGKFVFIRKEEKNLEKKYGQPYLEYKKHVKL
jgi:protein-S-isoprenylcysteine O-methyltransferase Ste14